MSGFCSIHYAHEWVGGTEADEPDWSCACGATCMAIRPCSQHGRCAPQKGSLTPSPSVTDDAPTYGAVTGGNGRSPLPCPACSLPTWDGIHATGHRLCGMHEVDGV